METKELNKLNEAVKHHDKLTISLCIELFKLRFKEDYKALCEGKEYPIGYFNEWCNRIKSGNARGYADNETRRALEKIGVN